MHKSVLRVACAFLLLTVALASGVGLISAVFAGESTTPSAPDTQTTAAPQSSPELVLVKLLIIADPEIRRVELLHKNGTSLQTLTPDAEGMVVTEPLQPGSYTAVSELGRVDFTLHENASVTTGDGCGWTDGEQLHLTRTQVGTVTVMRTLAAEDPAAAGGWVDFTLMGGGYYDRAVVRQQSAGQQQVACTFYGVPYGTYVLSENGVPRAEVTVGELRAHPQVSLT